MGKNKGRKNNDRAFWEPTELNDATFLQYYNRLMELSMAMFEWKGLPDTIDPRYMELALFSDGHAVFFKDEVLGHLCLRCAVSGPFTVYRVPTRRSVITSNGYTAQLNDSDSVIIYNNLLRTGSMLDVQMFAHRLYDLDRTVDVNVRAQKTPVLVLCDENERLTLENVYNQINGNKPVIFGSKALNIKDVKAVTTGAPFVADKIFQLKTQIWNEALTYLGISNINVSKKERLITDEVTRNQGGVIASRYSRLESRRQACREINKMFGLKIWCDYREDFQDIELGADDTISGEPNSDGGGGSVE